MRYRPDLPLVLKGLSFDVKGGEKVRPDQSHTSRKLIISNIRLES